jgi:hypothetical protein
MGAKLVNLNNPNHLYLDDEVLRFLLRAGVEPERVREMRETRDRTQWVEVPDEDEPSFGAYCEDYPCCGHTPLDPCNYSGPTSEDMLANPYKYHLDCEHEAGYCQHDDEDDEEDED